MPSRKDLKEFSDPHSEMIRAKKIERGKFNGRAPYRRLQGRLSEVRASHFASSTYSRLFANCAG
jgi:hypothetical protein